MSEALEAFRQKILADPSLRDELLAETEESRFVALVERKATEFGLVLSEAEVVAAIREGRQAWHQRRI